MRTYLPFCPVGCRIVLLVWTIGLVVMLGSCCCRPQAGQRPLEGQTGTAAAEQAQAPQEEPSVDPFMGDWQGGWRLDDGSDSGSLGAQVIALGKGQYQARLLEGFDARVKPYVVLQGQLEDRKVSLSGHSVLAKDPVELEAQAVIEADKFTGAFKGREEANGQEHHGTFSLSKTVRLSPTLGARPPSSAVVLFDGKNFDQWERMGGEAGKKDVRWKLLPDGAMEVNPGTGSIVTKKKSRDFKLHIEFRTPFMPEARGQGRGNSGVYLQGRYEVQVLDSYGLEGQDNECGGIYQVGAPLINMCAPPMQWQTYDITFTAPRFNSSGEKTQDAGVTVVHNGGTIHDRLKIPRPTGGSLDNNAAEPGGIYLQDHGNLVQFRNIWLVEL